MLEGHEADLVHRTKYGHRIDIKPGKSSPQIDSHAYAESRACDYPTQHKRYNSWRFTLPEQTS